MNLLDLHSFFLYLIFGHTLAYAAVALYLKYFFYLRCHPKRRSSPPLSCPHAQASVKTALAPGGKGQEDSCGAMHCPLFAPAGGCLKQPQGLCRRYRRAG